MDEAQGEAVAVLNHNRIMAYMVPADVYEFTLQRLDDLYLAELAKERASERVSRSILMTYSLEFLPSARKEWDKLEQRFVSSL